MGGTGYGNTGGQKHRLSKEFRQRRTRGADSPDVSDLLQNNRFINNESQSEAGDFTNQFSSNLNDHFLIFFYDKLIQ